MRSTAPTCTSPSSCALRASSSASRIHNSAVVRFIGACIPLTTSQNQPPTRLLHMRFFVILRAFASSWWILFCCCSPPRLEELLMLEYAAHGIDDRGSGAMPGHPLQSGFGRRQQNRHGGPGATQGCPRSFRCGQPGHLGLQDGAESDHSSAYGFARSSRPAYVADSLRGCRGV